MSNSELRTETHPLMILHDFEGNSSGSALDEWPLHFTITPFFTLEDSNQDEAIALIADIGREIGPFVIEAGETAMYGPNNDIPVTKIKDVKGELSRLHTSLLRGLGGIGCNFTDLTYALENYSPHISHKDSHDLSSSPYIVRGITVARKMPKGAERNKIILEKISL